MDINLASLAGNLRAPRQRRRSEEPAMAPTRIRRLVSAMSVLLVAVGL